MKESKEPEAPAPPQLERRIDGHQWPALMVLLIPPILAVLGVFGNSTRTSRAEDDVLRLEVVYPSRSRLGTPGELDLKVTNLGPSELDTVTVSVDTAYLGAFRDVSAVPDLDEPGAVRLANVRPGDTREVRLGMRAAGFGLTRGAVEARHRGETTGLPIRTFIFP